jgi:hypothetical protein
MKFIEFLINVFNWFLSIVKKEPSTININNSKNVTIINK